MLVPVLLTKGEAKALTILIECMGDRVWACERLGISKWTLHRHLVNINNKTGTNGALDLISLMWRNVGYLR